MATECPDRCQLSGLCPPRDRLGVDPEPCRHLSWGEQWLCVVRVACHGHLRHPTCWTPKWGTPKWGTLSASYLSSMASTACPVHPKRYPPRSNGSICRQWCTTVIPLLGARDQCARPSDRDFYSGLTTGSHPLGPHLLRRRHTPAAPTRKVATHDRHTARFTRTRHGTARRIRSRAGGVLSAPAVWTACHHRHPFHSTGSSAGRDPVLPLRQRERSPGRRLGPLPRDDLQECPGRVGPRRRQSRDHRGPAPGQE